MHILKERFRAFRARRLRRSLRARAEKMAFRGNSVCVVAPHPDDETFGCGGMIAQRVALGHQVRIIVLTNGEASLRGREGIAADDVVERRQAHVLAAAKTLGVEAEWVVFLGMPDGDIPRPGHPSFTEAVRRVTAEIDGCAAMDVYCPNHFDVWDDHVRAWEITKHAASLATSSPTVYGYCVWIWHNLAFRQFADLASWPVSYFPLADTRRQKQAAMDCFTEELAPGTDVPYCGRLPNWWLQAIRVGDEFFLRYDGVEGQ